MEVEVKFDHDESVNQGFGPPLLCRLLVIEAGPIGRWTADTPPQPRWDGQPRERGRWHRILTSRRTPLIAGAFALVIAIVASTVMIIHRSGNHSVAYGPQMTLPISGLNTPLGIAVDRGGDIYIADTNKHQVLRIAATTTNQTVLPFTDLRYPQGVAVDGSGNVYVTDINLVGGDYPAVRRLATETSQESVLPLRGLPAPTGIAVDGSGTIYVADPRIGQVVKLTPGSTTQTVLPVTDTHPDAVAVDSDDNLYITEAANNRVVRVEAKTNVRSTLPFDGLRDPFGVAVDGDGNVYVADTGNHRVLRLAAGSTHQSALPVAGMEDGQAAYVAVDGDGNVYVSDPANGWVLKFPRI